MIVSSLSSFARNNSICAFRACFTLIILSTSASRSFAVSYRRTPNGNLHSILIYTFLRNSNILAKPIQFSGTPFQQIIFEPHPRKQAVSPNIFHVRYSNIFSFNRQKPLIYWAFRVSRATVSTWMPCANISL